MQLCPISERSPIQMPPRVLEDTTHVDEDTLPQVDVLSELRVEGREEEHRFRQLLPDELTQQRTGLVRIAARRIEPRRDLQRARGRGMHELVRVGAGHQPLPTVDQVEEFLAFHTLIVPREA